MIRTACWSIALLVLSSVAHAADTDGDGVLDALDNCTLVANPSQYDADGDGYGNICDADLNQSGRVTSTDYLILRNALNTTNPVCDLDSSGSVTVADYTILRKRLNTPPGPSGLHGPTDSPPFLPYGSADPSVVFLHPLTTNPDGTGGLTATIYGAPQGPEHNPANGMRGAAAGGSTASGYYLTGFSAQTLAALNVAGQISFEISTRYFTQTAAYAFGSNGDNLAFQTTPIHFANAAAPASGQIHILRRAAGIHGAARVTAQGSSIGDGSQHSFLGWTNIDVSSPWYDAGQFNSYGKPADGFTRINVGWYTDTNLGRIVVMAVDGVVLQWALRSDTVNPFTHFTLGSSATWFNGNFIGAAEQMTDANHWMRYLQISTRPPTVPMLTTGPLKDIAIMSDSIIPASDWFSIGWKDINVDVRIVRAMEGRGVRPTTFYRMTAGGHTMTGGIGSASFISGDPSTQVVSSGSTGTDVRGLVKARNPTTIIINGGSNDVGYAAANTANFRAAMRDHVEYFCGLNGASHGGADYSGNPPAVMPSYIFFTNIPDRGFNWDGAAAAVAVLNGTATVSSVSNPAAFANGDLVGGYVDSGLYIPADTTVVSGGGTATLALSQAVVGSGSIYLYKLTEHPDSAARQKAASFRAEINAMPAWFAATFPNSPVKVRVIDTFGATGGTAVFPGKILHDGVHPNYYGIYNGSEAIAAALIGTL